MSDDVAPETAVNRGNAGQGRPKGSLNKVTLAARDAILLAAEGMGGVQRLIKWALKDDENEKIFWSVIYPKVLPFGGGSSASAAAVVTGALVWRRPEGVEAPAPATAIAAAEVAVQAATAAAAAGTGVAAGGIEPGEAVEADPNAAAEAAAVDQDAAAQASAGPAPVAATVVWKAPGADGTGGLPGLPGGPPSCAGNAGGEASNSPALPRPPPET